MPSPARDSECPNCGLTYGQLRTGLTYADVYLQLWVYNEDSTTWRYKRRHTILGFWMTIKKDMWSQHLGECDYNHRTVEEAENLEATSLDDFIPGSIEDFIPF